MDYPTMFDARPVAPDTTTLEAYDRLPGLGVLPINTFVIRAAQPVLIDTGLAALRQDFMRRLRATIAPEEIRWIWLTHTDADHVGNLEAVLAEAPRARVVTTYLGMGKMNLLGLPLDRVYLLNPGQSLDVGDRQLVAVKPPTFDAPETTGLFDTKSRVLFSADSFGALLAEPAETAASIAPSALRDGLLTWAAVDAPWLGMVDEAAFRKRIDAVRRFDPELILSNHLPAAAGMTETLLGLVAAAPSAPPFVGPDQAALEAMMAAA